MAVEFWANGANGGIVEGGGGWWRRRRWNLYHQLPQQRLPPLLSLGQESVGGVEGVPWCVSFGFATVVIIGTIFVSICGTMAQRTTAAAIDEVVVPITMAGKRWDITTPSAWSNKNRNKNKNKNKHKNKNKNKNKNKTNNSGGNITASAPADSYTMLPPLMPLRKQRQRRRQHGGSSGSSSSRVVAAAAHYFELPRSFTASGIKFPFFIRQYLSEKNDTGD
jgi:hypothetical protein